MSKESTAAEKLDQETIEGITPCSGELVQLPTGSGVPSLPVQRVQTQYVTAVAVQKPRKLAEVVSNVLIEAKLAGAAFYFRWEVYDKRKKKYIPIQGPSIDLAMCVARNFGNCVADIGVEELPSHWVFRAVFIDLETGFTLPRLYRQRRMQDLGKMDDDRAQDMTFQIGQSKAQRNAVIKAMPGWLVDQAIDAARSAEIKKIKPENIILARAAIVDFFGKYGIEVEAIEAKVGRKIDLFTAEDIIDLRTTASAIKEGHVDAKDVFEMSALKEAVKVDEAGRVIQTDPETPFGMTNDRLSDAPGQGDSGKVPEQKKEPEEISPALAKLRAAQGISKTEAWQRDRWINRKSGFQDYVVANIKDLRSETVEIQLAVQDKWKRLKIKTPSFDQVLTGNDYQISSEGGDKGEGEKVPGTVPDGTEIPEEVGNKTEPPENMTEQEALKELTWQQAKYPEYYQQAVGPDEVGVCPVDDVKGWAIAMMDAIKAKVEFDHGGTF